MKKEGERERSEIQKGGENEQKKKAARDDVFGPK
jgi:hypothetical protein